jgi:hypothetical protein
MQAQYMEVNWANGNDPEIKIFLKGRKKIEANLTLATNETYKGRSKCCLKKQVSWR